MDFIVKGNELQIEELVAMPHGNSCRINISKKHRGKIIKVIIPENPLYKWIMNKSVENHIWDAIDNAKLGQPYANQKRLQLKNTFRKILKESFEIEELAFVLNRVNENLKKEVLEKIIETYSL